MGFNMPKKSEEILANYRRLTAPVTGFLDDCCAIDHKNKIRCKDLYRAWCIWATANGYEAGAIETFGSHLQAAESTIRRQRKREDGEREYFYVGVELNQMTNCP